MPRQTDVPSNRVGRVVQNYIDDGSTVVTATEQADGNWTVEAD